jgi:hypothetical protein
VMGNDRALALEGTGEGLVSFDIAGLVLNTPVRANWDGHVLRLSDCLYRLALLSMRVEEVFASEASWAPRSGQPGSPAAVALALVSSLDEVQCVEYNTKCADGCQRTRWLFPA